MADYIDDAAFSKIIALLRQTGRMIAGLQGYVEEERKPDGSPVTIADKLAGQMIVEGLARITPGIPVICEESPEADNLRAAQSRLRWLTDPLDGTRTFLGGYDGYGCHLALIDGDKPVLGFALFPSNKKDDVLYYTGADGKAYKQEGQNPAEKIHVTNRAANETLIAASGWKDEIGSIGQEPVIYIPAVGGDILCITAAGIADVAWMNRYFSHWDTAAAQAILCAAGGEVIEIATGEPVRYPQNTLIVPPLAGGNPETLQRLGLIQPAAQQLQKKTPNAQALAKKA